MRVFMMTDLEGPCGVNGRPATGSPGNQIINPETAKKALTNEVNACIEGLVAAGADSVTVVDGHGGSNSIDIFALHPAAELVQYGGPFAYASPEGKYDAAVQIGAHAMQNSGGFLCHTFNSHGTSEMRMNGAPIGEIGIETYICAYFGIPMVLVSGDDPDRGLTPPACCRVCLDTTRALSYSLLVRACRSAGTFCVRR